MLFKIKANNTNPNHTNPNQTYPIHTNPNHKNPNHTKQTNQTNPNQILIFSEQAKKRILIKFSRIFRWTLSKTRPNQTTTIKTKLDETFTEPLGWILFLTETNKLLIFKTAKPSLILMKQI